VDQAVVQVEVKAVAVVVRAMGVIGRAPQVTHPVAVEETTPPQSKRE